MSKHKIVFLVRAEPDLETVERGLQGLDYDLEVHWPDSPGETIEAAEGSEIVINYSVPMPREVVEGLDTTRAIVSLGHGFDHVDHQAAAEKGIIVANTAAICSEEVSNHTIMLLLACSRRLIQLNGLVKSGRWEETASERTHVGTIYGQTLGIVGFGNIARATARKARALDMEVIAYDPYAAPWIARDYRVELVESMEELAARSDFVSMLVPLNNETWHLAGETFFRTMKPTAYFINTCRGGTVDEEALAVALRNGQIAGAGLDVFEQEPTPSDNPLLTMDNVIVTPHSAGTSNRSMLLGFERLGEETARVLRGQWPISLVNPEVRSRVEDRTPAANR